MKTKILILVLISTIYISGKNEKKELFKGEKLLKNCLLDIPLTYSRANDKIVAERAKELKDKEIVFLQYLKKENEFYYYRYYLISEKSTKGATIYNYFIPVDKYHNYLNGKKVMVFIGYRKRFDRFYLAECFDVIVKEHPEITYGWIKS